jgi:hypothetical protein
MIDDVAAGQAVFYDFYTPPRRTRNHRGGTRPLLLAREAGAPFAVIAPVAGSPTSPPCTRAYHTRSRSASAASTHCSPVPRWTGGRIATEDLAAALTYIFRNAGGLGVTTADYSLWGSSAGARMAASIGSYGTARFDGASLTRPSAVVLLYTGHSDLAPSEPPTFVAVGAADGIAPPAVMERRVAALRRAGTDVEYHRYRASATDSAWVLVRAPGMDRGRRSLGEAGQGSIVMSTN